MMTTITADWRMAKGWQARNAVIHNMLGRIDREHVHGVELPSLAESSKRWVVNHKPHASPPWMAWREDGVALHAQTAAELQAQITKTEDDELWPAAQHAGMSPRELRAELAKYEERGWAVWFDRRGWHAQRAPSPPIEARATWAELQRAMRAISRMPKAVR